MWITAAIVRLSHLCAHAMLSTFRTATIFRQCDYRRLWTTDNYSLPSLTTRHWFPVNSSTVSALCSKNWSNACRTPSAIT